MTHRVGERPTLKTVLADSCDDAAAAPAGQSMACVIKSDLGFLTCWSTCSTTSMGSACQPCARMFHPKRNQPYRVDWVCEGGLFFGQKCFHALGVNQAARCTRTTTKQLCWNSAVIYFLTKRIRHLILHSTFMFSQMFTLYPIYLITVVTSPRF